VAGVGLAALVVAVAAAMRIHVCVGRSHETISHRNEKCPARSIPVEQLDTLMWQDVCEMLTHPEKIANALYRAQGGQWLPQECQARRENLRKARVRLEQQMERLTDAYLANVLHLDEYKRRRLELEQRLSVIAEQKRQLEATVGHHDQLAGMVQSIEAFCQRVQQGLSEATFEQKRQLVELLIDRVVVTGEEVEIRYVISTSPKGETIRFCHLRVGYFHHPVIANQRQHPRCRSLLQRETTQAIHDFLLHLSGGEGSSRSLDAKYLCNTFPLLAKPLVEIGTTGDVSMFQASMCFVPGLGLLPSSSVRSAVCKQVFTILSQRRLMVFGNQHVVALKPMDLGTQLLLGVHGIQTQNASFDQRGGEQRLESTDLILLVGDIALPQHDSRLDIIATQQMHPMLLGTGGTQSLAVNRQLLVFSMPLLRA
jgi:hypothetical protein